MSTEKFCLKWNDFESNISHAFREIRDEKDFFDVTLACDDDQLQAHKVILSACSPFFRKVLKRNPHQHPLLYLKGVKYTDLQSVLNFMYHGEVNVAQDELNSFLAVAEELRVKGLTQNNQGSSSNSKKDNPPASKSPPPKSRSSEPMSAPPAKRSRPSNNPPPPSSSVPTAFAPEDDDIQEVVPVKSEPRDPPTAGNALAADPYAAGGTALAPTNHQLQTEEDATYDESYDDYGQYDQSYDSSMMDPNMSGDSNKDYLDELASIHLTRNSPGYTCNICGRRMRDRCDGKRHLESHFPTDGGYICARCEKSFNTQNAHRVHLSTCMRENAREMF